MYASSLAQSGGSFPDGVGIRLRLHLQEWGTEALERFSATPARGMPAKVLRCLHAVTTPHPRSSDSIRRRRVLLGRAGLWRWRTGPGPVDRPHHLLDGRLPRQALTGRLPGTPHGLAQPFAPPDCVEEGPSSGTRATHQKMG